MKVAAWACVCVCVCVTDKKSQNPVLMWRTNGAVMFARCKIVLGWIHVTNKSDAEPGKVTVNKGEGSCEEMIS